MTHQLLPLQKGDLVRIVSPAKTIATSFFLNAKKRFEDAGFIVKIGQYAQGQYHYFSGTDEERIADMQEALNDKDCKLIVCSRGGYGSIRVLEKLDWNAFMKNPKWLCGFSDITYFLSKIHCLDFMSLHATMPLNYFDNTLEAMISLFNAIEGKENSYTFMSNPENCLGTVQAELVGGNLSVLYSLLGTKEKFNYKNKLLFIEDVGEQRYAIDRMLYTFKKAGVFDEICGLIVGGMTELKETLIPTEFTVEEIVLHHFKKCSIPICFDFPVGHFNDNRAMIVGKIASLEVTNEKVIFKQ